MPKFVLIIDENTRAGSGAIVSSLEIIAASIIFAPKQPVLYCIEDSVSGRHRG